MHGTLFQELERRADRVRDHSAHGVNRRILRRMETTVEHCIRQGRAAVCNRLAEIDREWDIDRVLMANFAIAGAAAYAIGISRYAEPHLFERPRGWLYFFSAQLAFLMMHTTVGWCPPVVVWRRLGVRTKNEIDVERAMLQAAIEPQLTAATPPDAAGPSSSNGLVTSTQVAS